MRRGWLLLCGALGCVGPSAPEVPIDLDAGPLDLGDATPGDAADSPPDAATADLGAADGGAPGLLSGPLQVSLPFVLAGAGATRATFTLENRGDEALDDLVYQLSGGAFALEVPPVRIPGRGQVTVEVLHPGHESPQIDRGTLRIESGPSSWTMRLHAVIGDPALPVATWEELPLAQAKVAGRGATIRLPSAPFPAPGRSWSDDRVQIFVPEGHPADAPIDLLLHFHGFGTTLADTLVAHRYREQVYASGAAAVLVVPQGPVSAQSGDFGKLMSPAGTALLLEHVRMVLYRDGLSRNPERGALYLSAHSGGYQAVAANLDPNLGVAGVGLFDALYGRRATFREYVQGDGRLYSNYSASGGTAQENQTLVEELRQLGRVVAEDSGTLSLRDADAVITFADTTHNGVTRHRGAYGEWLRFLAPGRSGPRIELLSALAEGPLGVVLWRAPRDPSVEGWVVDRLDAAGWAAVTTLGAEATSAQVPLGAGGRLRVRPVVRGRAEDEVQESDNYRLDPAPQRLIVDAFDRVIGGGHAGLAHDFAARVGEAAGPAATVGHRAIDEGAASLSGWPLVIWLAGDQSRDDLSFTDVESEQLTAYLDAGGRLIVSGSEVAYDLVARDPGFLTELGASYLADANPAREVSGAGALASLGPLRFGGPSAPYAVGYPDVLGPAPGAEVLLRYPDGSAAAVGVPGRSVLLGFPLETVDDPEELRRLLVELERFLSA